LNSHVDGLIELVNLLSNFFLLGGANLSDNLEAFSLESHQFSTETKAGAAPGVKPLRSVPRSGLLADNRLREGRLSSVLANLAHLLRALRVQRQYIGVAFGIKGSDLAVEVL